MTALLVLVALLVSGCMGTLAKGERSELAEIIRAGSKDTGTWCLTVNLVTPWGTEVSTLTRTNLAAGTVSCDRNGLTVKSGEAQ